MQIILISGFLGSGKTTLLIQLSDYLFQLNPPSDSASSSTTNKIAIIENEIGSINLDSRMLNKKGYTLREMLSGCICCSLQDNLGMEITNIAKSLQPDWLLIEATGLASAREVAEGIRSMVDKKHYSSIFSIVLADTSRLPMLLQVTERMVHRQLEYVDALILNKIDLITSGQLDQCRQELLAINPDMQVIEVSAEKGIPSEVWQRLFEGKKAG